MQLLCIIPFFQKTFKKKKDCGSSTQGKATTLTPSALISLCITQIWKLWLTTSLMSPSHPRGRRPLQILKIPEDFLQENTSFVAPTVV